MAIFAWAAILAVAVLARATIVAWAAVIAMAVAAMVMTTLALRTRLLVAAVLIWVE